MRVLCSAVGIALGVAATASAQPVRLSLSETLARARDQAPSVLIALARIEESRARLVGASLRYPENPSLDVSGGPRWKDGGTYADFEVGYSQRLQTGGQRDARIAAADAAVDAATAETDDARREVMASAATLFFRVSYAQARLTLLESSEQAAAEVLRLATLRYEAGDIAVLDLNLGRSALARARSARSAADADRRIHSAELGRMIGMPTGEVVASDALVEARPAELERLMAAIDTRPDLRALNAGLAEANADVRLGAASHKPDLSLGGWLKREGGEHAVIAGLTIALPTVIKGQELQAAANARSARIRQELDVARANAISEVRALHDAYAVRRTAVEAFEQDALPNAIESEQLAQRSFEEGQLTLTDLIVVRRELVDTRLEYLDRLLEAAETAIARDAAAGVLQ
jgi:outer membrane protein, heavy metal efflux system